MTALTIILGMLSMGLGFLGVFLLVVGYLFVKEHVIRTYPRAYKILGLVCWYIYAMIIGIVVLIAAYMLGAGLLHAIHTSDWTRM